MSTEDFVTTHAAFTANYKGSNDMYDLMEQRIYREGDPLATEESK